MEEFQITADITEILDPSPEEEAALKAAQAKAEEAGEEAVEEEQNEGDDE